MCHQSFIELLTLVRKIFEKIKIVLLFCSLVYTMYKYNEKYFDKKKELIDH